MEIIVPAVSQQGANTYGGGALSIELSKFHGHNVLEQQLVILQVRLKRAGEGLKTYVNSSGSSVG